MNRRQQNQAKTDWDALKVIIVKLDPFITTVLLRGTHDSGIRKSLPLANDPGLTAYNDETGETAIMVPVGDDIERAIAGMADNIHRALNNAKRVLAVVPVDVTERALRSIPDCSACGDPIVAKIYYGRWDGKCRARFTRWVDSGNPADEKLRFERIVQSERLMENNEVLLTPPVAA